MPKVFIKTYGCQMNERDSEQVSRDLIARGYELTGSEQEADVVLLNTCSVRDMAEQKAIGKMGMLSRLRQNRPEMVFGFLGCMAQSRGAELTRDLGHVDLVVGTQKFHRVADYVEQLVQRKQALRDQLMDDVRFSIVDIEEEAGSQETIREHILTERQATAFVSIMQGCNMMCTYCIVPFTRGSERARRIEEIVSEVEGLVAGGVREVTLLGQIVNLYGRHEFPFLGGNGADVSELPENVREIAALTNGRGVSPFVQLLAALNDIEGLERIRFTSPHPIGFREDLVGSFRLLPKLMPHVHLPLQSGSDRILKAMHRGYTAEKFITLTEKLREARPDIAITTDVIVGFPGETDSDYTATRELFERVSFDNAFIFRYSKRRDTPASELPDQVSESIKEARNQDLLGLVDDLARAKGDAVVNTRQQILCEGFSKTNADRLMGRTPQNKIVIFEGDADRHTGKVFDVHIERSTGFTLYGTPAVF
jgi:tRNA-2-methylthio-N6-dimethylallyladenosine synthase